MQFSCHATASIAAAIDLPIRGSIEGATVAAPVGSRAWVGGKVPSWSSSTIAVYGSYCSISVWAIQPTMWHNDFAEFQMDRRTGANFIERPIEMPRGRGGSERGRAGASQAADKVIDKCVAKTNYKLHCTTGKSVSILSNEF